MRVIRRDFYEISRRDTIIVLPLGDIHLGAAACDEKRLISVVERIARDENCYFVGLGDYCDFINRSDPRFSSATLAPWISMRDLGDLARAQRDRFLDIIKPIAPRCLAMCEGNHETAIAKHYERQIGSEIVSNIKQMGGFPDDHNLFLGYNGWLILGANRGKKGEKRRGANVIKVNLHHGFVGGRLAGAKALNMQRWLWTHDADLVLFGHSHNTGVQVESVETVTVTGRIRHKRRIGAYCGTFLRSYQEGASTYAEVKGYFPMPISGVEVKLRPRATNEEERISVLTGYG